jgi:hypothetical protein
MGTYSILLAADRTTQEHNQHKKRNGPPLEMTGTMPQ